MILYTMLNFKFPKVSLFNLVVYGGIRIVSLKENFFKFFVSENQLLQLKRALNVLFLSIVALSEFIRFYRISEKVKTKLITVP